MSEENLQEVVRLWWEAINEDGMPPRELCDENIVIRNVAEMPDPGPYRGYEGVREWLTNIFEVVDQARFELEDSIEVGDGETVVTDQRCLGSARHTRLDVDYLWTAVWRVCDGRILFAQGYATHADALKAAGLSQ
jgi:ketosteroid isomerase-like protein